MPVGDLLGLPAIMANQALSEVERTRKIKSQALKHFADHRYLEGKLIVYEASQELYFYDKNGAWSISELNTGENAGDIQAILDRPLAKLPKFILVPNALDLIPEALLNQDDCMCVPTQIAALTGQDAAKVADQFDAICPGWREEGISSYSILAS